MKESNRAVTDLLIRTQGVDISKYEDSFLEKSLQKRIAETHCGSQEAYCNLLEENNQESTKFLESLHNSYSEFFRNPLTFSVLEKIVIPSIVRKKADSKRNEIRIWSAACAGGQETYSLAMLLKEFKNSNGETINFRIFATDQSELQVSEARKGQYSPAALNNISLKRVNQWFIKQGDTYTVRQELKENIDFSVFDLFGKEFSCPPTSIFGDFDLVVCANLLFYYKPEFQKRILEKAGNCLKKGGSLITGETEREILMQHNFQEVFPQSAIFRPPNPQPR